MLLLEQTLIRAVAVGAVSSAALTIYLVCLRFVAWDLVPATCLAQAQWWQRHARPFLVVALVITGLSLVELLIVRTAG